MEPSSYSDPRPDLSSLSSRAFSNTNEPCLFTAEPLPAWLSSLEATGGCAESARGSRKLSTGASGMLLPINELFSAANQWDLALGTVISAENGAEITTAHAHKTSRI